MRLGFRVKRGLAAPEWFGVSGLEVPKPATLIPEPYFYRALPEFSGARVLKSFCCEQSFGFAV